MTKNAAQHRRWTFYEAVIGITMKLTNCLLIVGVAVITMCPLSRAADLIQTTGQGNINWSKDIITVQQPDLDTAQQSLWEIIENLRLNNQQLLGEVMSHNKDLKAQLQQLVQKAKAVESTTGPPQLKLQLPLKGAFIEALLATRPSDSVGRRPAMFGRPASTPGAGGPRFMREITGLVIDARGLKVTPAITPQILAEDGQLIYGLKKVNHSYIVNQGLVEYTPDMAAAGGSKRVANNPMLIKAIAVDAETGTDLIVGNRDAQRIKRTAKKHDFLYKCRVIIVIDQPK